MTDRLNYCWRLVATGICFATFGIGGLALSTLVFPLLLLAPHKDRARRARWLVHKSFSTFMGMMETLGVMHLEVIGAERLRTCRNTLVLANHPTLIDVVALISLMPEASCVVKQALWENPFLGGVVRAADYVKNSEPESLINDCSNDLVAGNPLIIFPEGTRSQPGKPLHFLRGAAHIVLKSDTPILPVLIDCVPPTLSQANKWWQIPDKRFHLRITVQEPIAPHQMRIDKKTESLSARQLTRTLEAYFTQELEQYGRI